MLVENLDKFTKQFLSDLPTINIYLKTHKNSVNRHIFTKNTIIIWKLYGFSWHSVAF